MTVAIRPAEVSDAEAISAIHISARRQAYADLMSPRALAEMARQVTPQQWAVRLRSSGWGMVAVEDGTVVGFVYVRPNDSQPDVGDFEALHVDPAHQGTGVGGLLHDAGLEILAQHGFSTFVLWVLEGNERAIRFYRNRGWHHDGRRFQDIGGHFLRFLHRPDTAGS